MGLGYLVLTALMLVVLYQLIPSTTADSHIESYQYKATGYTQSVTAYYYTYCTTWGYYPYWNYYNCYYRNWYYGYYGWYYYPWWWGYRSYCYTAVGYNYYYTSYQYTVTAYKCQTGWVSYPSCDTPICNNPTCRTGQTCTAPNTCECVSSASNTCANQACNMQLNCYPGTCIDTVKNVCKCPPGFYGSNCQSVSLLPEISTCGATLFGGNPGQPVAAVATATECAALGLDEQYWGITWIGLGNSTTDSLPYTQLQVTWQANYVNQFAMPDYNNAPFVQNAPVPLGVYSSSFTVLFPGTGILPQTVTCSKPTNQDQPSILQCTSQTKAWSELGASLNIKHNSTMLIQINAALGGAGKIGSSNFYFPKQEFTGNTTTRSIKFQFDFMPPTHCVFTPHCNGSIYPIFLNQTVITQNNKIQPTFNAWTDNGSGISKFHVDMYYLQPDINGVLDSVGSPISSTDVDIALNNFIYNCPKPGTYSIVLTVYDRARNSAKVRKIFTYNDQPSIIKTNASLYIDGADPGTDYQFFTNLVVPQNGADYKFVVKWPGLFVSTFKNEWLGQVNRWPLANHVHDDIDGNTYSIRTTDKLTSFTGVLTYEFAFTVDSVGGIGVQEPSAGNFTSLNNTNVEQYAFNVSQSLLSEDGRTVTMWLKAYDLNGNVTVAQSKVTLQKNNDLTVENPKVIFGFNDSYHTGIELEVRSKVGGVKNISFSVFDKTLNTWVSMAQNLNAVVMMRDRPNTKRRKRDSPTPCNDNTCYCIPLGMCYNLIQVLSINNCDIDQYRNDVLEVHYTVYTLSGYQRASFVTIDKAGNKIACRPLPSLSPGAIVGIVIALLILLLLLLLLLLMFWRWRHHKHPVPERFRSVITHFHNRNAPQLTTENELYTSEIELTDKYDNKLKTQPNNARKMTVLPPNNKNNAVVTCKNVQMENTILGEGRFAVIRKAVLLRGNQNIPVAVKALRSGYSKDDVNIMNQKILFMSKIPNHVNLANYIATYKDDINGSEQALLLDCCEQPLPDWLSGITQVTPEVLDNMLTFSLNIARGLEHLHGNNVLHKRLCAKNVLLVNTVNGTVAKLIGYGPSKDDQCSAGEQPILKIKYLAPETLSTMKAINPVYDNTTDAWSYGVTMWEIYSKGGAPYADISSGDVLKHQKSGHKLPCPDDCAEELYQTTMLPCWDLKSAKRPSFTAICRSLENFRNGSGGKAAGYYAADDVSGPQHVPKSYYTPSDINEDEDDNEKDIYDDAK